MNSMVSIRKLNASESELILTIAHWYLDEWSAPIEKTIKRLSHQPDGDVLFQLVLTCDSEVVATGGLCYSVNLLNVHERFKNLGPWVSLLYTEGNHRNKGFGKVLLDQMEQHAQAIGLSKIYLYTFTAERFYARNGWKVMESVHYKNHDTVIMEKSL